jgi:hypothetical protein
MYISSGQFITGGREYAFLSFAFLFSLDTAIKNVVESHRTQSNTSKEEKEKESTIGRKE